MMKYYSWQRKTAGFTLLEILVVVVIISVLSTAFMMSMGSSREDAGRKEAQRFAALVRLAGQEAMLRSRDLAVEILPQGYSFFMYEEQGWQPLQDEVLRKRNLPEGMSFTVLLDGSRLQFVQNESDVNDADSKNNEQQPRIYLFSSGEMTPFEMILLIDGAKHNFQITGGLGGKLVLSEQG